MIYHICAFLRPEGIILNGEGGNVFCDNSQMEASIFKDL